jgi:RND family efflux transporter MFP subunit
MRFNLMLPVLTCTIIGQLSGCSRPQPALAPPPTPEVTVQYPTVQTVVQYEDFIGRTEAIVSVDLRSRVTGYLDSIHFKEGTDVEANKLLFMIDPKLYQAEFDKTEASVKQARAHSVRLKKDYDRGQTLLARGAMSPEEFDRIAGDKAEADAALEVALAAQKFAEQNLSYTQIKAPFSGRISRRYVDPGNLVKADETSLTSIVQLNPIHAYFDVDDRTLLEIRRTNKDLSEPVGNTPIEGKPQAKAIEVKVGLPDRETFELLGTVNFFDNKVDPGTSTLRFRAQIDNKNLLLSPGLFVRVRMQLGELPNAVLVPEEAIGSNQEHKFVYVVNDENTVYEQRVVLGSQYEGKRLIKSGLKGTEKVIVSGLQKVRPKSKVTIKGAIGPKADKPTSPATNATPKSVSNGSSGS